MRGAFPEVSNRVGVNIMGIITIGVRVGLTRNPLHVGDAKSSAVSPASEIGKEA